MPIRVLLIDQSDEFRGAARGLLQRERDVTVLAEASGVNQASLLARVFRPDVISVGLEACRLGIVEQTIRELAGSTRVVVLSLDNEDASLIDKAVRAGASGFVWKYDALYDLLPAIRAVASGSTFFSPAFWPSLGTSADRSV